MISSVFVASFWFMKFIDLFLLLLVFDVLSHLFSKCFSFFVLLRKWNFRKQTTLLHVLVIQDTHIIETELLEVWNDFFGWKVDVIKYISE